MTEFVEIDGIKTAYVTEGSGKDVLFLHGWGVDKSSFAPVIREIVKDCRVTALDFPGFGQTPEPNIPWGSEDFANFTAHFIEKIGLEKPVIAGHSNGGKTAIRLIGNGYTNVSKLVLLGSTCLKPKRKPTYYIRSFIFKFGKVVLSLPLLRRLQSRLSSKFGSDDYRKASALLKKTMVKLLAEDLRDLLPKITVPTLLVWGENDTAVPLSDAKIMEKLIPNAGLIVYRNSGHYAFIENLQAFCSAFHYFITH